MNAKKLQLNIGSNRRTIGRQVWWAGLGLALLAALALSAAIRNAAAKTAADPPIRARLNTAVNAQSVRAHPNLHSTNPSRRAQPVVDADTQSVLDYLRLHTSGPAIAGQSAPNSSAQTVPDAAAQGVMGYLSAHETGPAIDRSFHTPPTSDYKPVDRSFHIPQTADYALVERSSQIPQTYFQQTFQAQAVPRADTQSYFLQLFQAVSVPDAKEAQAAPDAATQGVMAYLRAHGISAPGLFDHLWLHNNQ